MWGWGWGWGRRVNDRRAGGQAGAGTSWFSTGSSSSFVSEARVMRFVLTSLDACTRDKSLTCQIPLVLFCWWA